MKREKTEKKISLGAVFAACTCLLSSHKHSVIIFLCVCIFRYSTFAVVKMPDRFKVTKTDAPEIDATYNSILKDEEAAAVLGKLLPPSSANTIDACERKGM